MNKVQTDNSMFYEKIKLREESLPNKEKTLVLELYSGDGKIWNKIKNNTKKKIEILKIDIKADKKGIYLKGDNLKFLGLLNIDIFDIIDLDSYGIPFKQLTVLFKKKYTGIVHVTFIQSGMGRLNNDLLLNLNYTREMIKKAPTLLSKNGFLKIKSFLSKNGIKKIRHITKERKHYFWFNMQGE